ncbi:hypothetical protein [Streptomyces sp. NPDC090025]|uniref:hypothetical protein n=1 Tax=Streptomyces sp. NPDC090025 TaxID=3365922 RepID=UPI003837EE41
MDAFLADVATTGTVLGAGLDRSPEQWQQTLGGAPLWVGETALGLVQDYGLLEIHHLRGEQAGTWRPFGFVIRTDRAETLTPTDVPPSLATTYGPHPGPAFFAPLRAAVESAGHTLDPYVEFDSDTEAGILRHRVRKTGVGITVIARAESHGGFSDDQLYRVSRFLTN